MRDTKAFFALLVMAVTRQASSKVSNVADDRGALSGVIFDERHLQGSENRGANRNHITDTAQKNIRDDVEQANSEDSAYTGGEYEQPPMTSLVDGADENAVETTGRKLATPSSTKKDGESFAKRIETNVYRYRAEGKHMNRRLRFGIPLRSDIPLRFEIPVEDTPYPLEDWFNTPTTLPPVTYPAALIPTVTSSHSPSRLTPTSQPTQLPSASQTAAVDNDETETPTGSPSLSPTAKPTAGPSLQPSGEPSHSGQPSAAPSSEFSSSPSRSPSKQTTDMPTTSPSLHPTQQPTYSPIELPSLSPSIRATLKPSSQPSLKNSAEPSMQPSLSTYEPTSVSYSCLCDERSNYFC